MKIYQSDQISPVNSRARAPEEEFIPPWSIPGSLRSRLLGAWPVANRAIITGARLVVLEANASANVSFVLMKHNAFQKNIVIATCTLAGNSVLEKDFAMASSVTGYNIISPYETLQIAVFVAGTTTHKDATIQIYSELLP